MGEKKEIPLDWARAYIILLAKSQDIENIAEFKPRATTSITGKIFFSVIYDRLQFFMIQNSYISRDIQNRFHFGVPGCLEHSFTLMEALKEAKELNRQILISRIDLANAYSDPTTDIWLLWKIMCNVQNKRMDKRFFPFWYLSFPRLCSFTILLTVCFNSCLIFYDI